MAKVGIVMGSDSDMPVKRSEIMCNNEESVKTAEELIKELGVTELKNSFKSDFLYIDIIGCIEGHNVLPQDNKTTKYEHILPQLLNAEENPEIKGVLITLNTVGGDVEAGLAIAEMIASLSKPVVSIVLGGGHSIGIPLAVSADYSFVTETATMPLVLMG